MGVQSLPLSNSRIFYYFCEVPFPQPLTTTSDSVSIDLPICDLSCLASFTLHNVFKEVPVSIYSNSYTADITPVRNHCHR